jgi:DNA-binding transcriptional ArsR family regulator
MRVRNEAPSSSSCLTQPVWRIKSKPQTYRDRATRPSDNLSSAVQDSLSEQFARIGKAVSNKQRLKLLELLAQAEHTVDALAKEASPGRLNELNKFLPRSSKASGLMPLANQNLLSAKAAMLVAVCVCLLGIAQVAGPLRRVNAGCSTAFAVAQQHLTRHAMQEVSPRTARPRAPVATGLRAVVSVTSRAALPRMTAFVPLWPIENWPTHRRVCPASADTPDPA